MADRRPLTVFLRFPGEGRADEKLEVDLPVGVPPSTLRLPRARGGVPVFDVFRLERADDPRGGALSAFAETISRGEWGGPPGAPPTESTTELTGAEEWLSTED